MTETNGQPQAEAGAAEETHQPPSIPPVRYAEPPAEAYYLPTISEDTTPAEAEQIIEAIKTEAGSDKKHPLTDGHHFQHKKWQTVWTRAHEIKATGSDNRSETRKACDEALAMQAEKQNAVHDRAVKLMGKLTEKHDFKPKTISKDIPEYQVDSWEQQLFIADGNFDEFGRVLAKDMQTIRTPSEIRQAYQAVIGHDSLPLERKTELAEMVARWVFEDKKYLAELGKPKKE